MLATEQLIDGKGRLWNAGSYELRRHLFVGDVDIDVKELAVRNLGYVQIRMAGRALVVTLAPGLISDATRLTLVSILQSVEVARIFLADATNPDSFRMYGRRADALRAIRHQVSDAKYDRQPRFRVKAGGIADSTELSELFGFWRSAGGHVVASALETRLHQLGLTRYSFVCREDRSEEPYFVDVSPGLQFPDRRWHRKLVGRFVMSVPDGDYGEWAATGHRRAFRDGAPRIEKIQAKIRRLTGPAVDHQYLRLILPCQATAGRSCLAVVSAAP